VVVAKYSRGKKKVRLKVHIQEKKKIRKKGDSSSQGATTQGAITQVPKITDEMITVVNAIYLQAGRV
jgi:hypothetical protein